MKLAALLSGGKDSNFAMFLASHEHDITCLLYLDSESSESYMFQKLGHDLIDAQAEAIGVPLIRIKTSGEKEMELEDLRKGLIQAKEEYGVEGLVTGALKSAYQSSRIQRICFVIS